MPRHNQENEEAEAQEAKVATVAKPPQLPAWLAYGGKVARFFAYMASSSRHEVRRFLVFFYLEDGSLEVVEQQQQQQQQQRRPRRRTFLRRHRVPAAPQQHQIAAFVTLAHFGVGEEIRLYGHVFFVYDADAFTRSWFEEKLGVALKPALECPTDAVEDAVEKHRKLVLQAADARRRNGSVAEHMEASLGRPSHWQLRQTKRFLENAGKVLRFWVVLDLDQAAQLRQESGEGGRVDAVVLQQDRHPLYVLHFFCSDNSAEIILDRSQRLKGEDFPTTLVRRQRLPRHFRGAACCSFGRNEVSLDAVDEFLCPGDFRIGHSLTVFGRRVLLLRADASTKAFYSGLSDDDLRDVVVQTPAKVVYQTPVPPPTGFGSEEDSLASCWRGQVPRTPKTDLKKVEKAQLEYVARLEQAGRGEAGRRFLVTYYLVDDTIAVFELKANAALGDKVVERARVRHPEARRWYRRADMRRDNVLALNGGLYRLLQPANVGGDKDDADKGRGEGVAV